MASYEDLKAQGIDPALIPENKWIKGVRVNAEEGWREDICWLQEPLEGVPGVSIKRKVNLFEEALLEENKQQYNTDQSFIRKGSELDAKVAAVPLNIFYNDERIQKGVKGDRDAMKNWLNDEENRKYRTIKGKI